MSSCDSTVDASTSLPASDLGMRRIQQQESLFTLALYPLERALTSILEAPLTLKLLSQIHATMRQLGISSDYHPTAETMLTSLLIILLSTVAYFRYQRRRRMARDLERAQAQLTYLQEKLAAVSQKHSNKQVRIFMDGAFDMMHYGHMNAFRLGRSLGTHLVVGINSDESITECKGPPLMKDEERLTMVQACKFVDQVVPGCPYIMNKEYLDYVIDKYKIDYVIHGDDPCIVDGKDVYAAAKEAGKFQSIPRTEGVSTTDIVGRMLLMTKEHHFHSSPNGGDKNPGVTALLGQTSRFLTTSHMLRLFSAGIKAPTPGMKVVYLDGAFDMFHCGHVAILQAAKQCGDYLIVGIHGDAIVNRQRGQNLPLMNLHERVLSVLGCRYVDDVLIDAPYHITPDMVASLKISVVVRGTKTDDVGMTRKTEDVRYRYPREAGILKIIESPSDFNIANIIQRIRENQMHFQAKYERKMKAEQEFYDEKYGRNEDDAAHEA